MQKQKKNITKRLVLDAVLIALYVLLGYFKIPIGNILRVNMANVRRKLEANPAEPEYIMTEVGIGYRMAEED